MELNLIYKMAKLIFIIDESENREASKIELKGIGIHKSQNINTS